MRSNVMAICVTLTNACHTIGNIIARQNPAWLFGRSNGFRAGHPRGPFPRDHSPELPAPARWPTIHACAQIDLFLVTRHRHRHRTQQFDSKMPNQCLTAWVTCVPEIGPSDQRLTAPRFNTPGDPRPAPGQPHCPSRHFVQIRRPKSIV